MKIYLAGSMLTTPERQFNVQLASRLRSLGHEVFVPQENPLGADRKGDLRNGPRGTRSGRWRRCAHGWRRYPDSGTCWECGDAYATKKPVVLFRSEFRGSGDADDIPYNAMLIGAAKTHIELRLGTVDEAADAIHADLVRLTPA